MAAFQHVLIKIILQQPRWFVKVKIARICRGLSRGFLEFRRGGPGEGLEHLIKVVDVGNSHLLGHPGDGDVLLGQKLLGQLHPPGGDVFGKAGAGLALKKPAQGVGGDAEVVRHRGLAQQRVPEVPVDVPEDLLHQLHRRVPGENIGAFPGRFPGPEAGIEGILDLVDGIHRLSPAEVD